MTLGNRALRLGWLGLWALLASFALAERDFKQVYSNTATGFRGDFTIIGNALVTCANLPDCANDTSQNNYQTMVFIDADGSDNATVNSSSATLRLPDGARVVYAALVWGGRENTQESARVPSEIKFKRPGDSGYSTLEADWVSYISGSFRTGQPYAAFKEVTGLLQELDSPNGTYWVADLDTRVGNDGDGLGYYGGWGLVVVYQSPSEPSIRRITVSAGLKKVDRGGNTVDLTFGGLVTPETGSYVMHLGVIAWEGDSGERLNGDKLQIGPDRDHLTELWNDVNPSDNFFNSTISHYGTYFHDKNPDYKNQFAVDEDLVEVQDLPNGITKVVARFTTDGDTYFPQVIVTSVELAIISGRVFEDVNGDANLNDARPKQGVTVKLYRDGGDGVPDGADDALVATATTNDAGKYSFHGIADGTYWVVVDSKTVEPEGFNDGFDQGDVWAEQTYGAGGSWGGALCDRDANSDTTAEPRSAGGPCYGGRRGDASDDASGLATAEHVAKVVVNGEVVTGVDFGFSFNVVTNTNDQDDDTGANRTAQGSLRQFVQNANAIWGANAMRFVPAVPKTAGLDYWRIEASRAMAEGDPFADGVGAGPVFRITDADTTIDGTAYKFDGSPWGAPGSHAGTSVGYLETCTIPDFDAPNLEVFTPRRHRDDHGAFADEQNLWDIGNAGEDASIFYAENGATNFVLRRVAAYGGHYAVYVDEAENARIEDNYLGVPASGLQDPGTDDSGRNRRSNRGVVVNGVQNVLVRHNLIGYTRLHGVFLYDVVGSYSLDTDGLVQSATALVEKNEVAYPSQGWWHENGIGLEDYSKSVVARCNYVHHSGAVGIETWSSQGYHWIGQNTVEQSGLGDTEFGAGNGSDYDDRRERVAIRLKAPNNVVRYNFIAQNQGVGVLVVGGYAQNLVSKNAFYRNGASDDRSRTWLAIDLLDGDLENTVTRNLGDGVLANDGAFVDGDGNRGLDYPVFTGAELDGADLRLEGYVGKAHAHLAGTYTIEVYKADDDENNNGEVEAGDGQSKPHGEGRFYLGSCSTEADGTFECTFSVASAGLRPGDAVTGIAIDADGNTSEFSANVAVRPPGVPVSGHVFYDLSANANRDAGEGWDPSYPQMYVKLIRGSGDSTEVVQVVPVNESTGAYRFDAVPPGEYRLIPDTSNDPNDKVPTTPSGWLFVGPAQREIVVAETPLVNQDFALFHGGVVLGIVFWDTGEGGGEANDVVRNGTERAVPGVVVTASDGVHTRSARTDGEGFFRIYIPKEWGSRHVTLSHPLRPATGYSTCLCGGEEHPVQSFSDAVAPDSSGASVDLGPAENITQLVRAFGVARPSAFRPDQSGSTTSPGARVYRHTYRPGTQGTVAFRRTGGDYTYQVRFDRNCDGDFEDGGEAAWVPVTNEEGPSWVVDGDWPRNPDGSFKSCLVEVRVLVPDGEPEGAVDLAEIAATLTWANNGAVADRRTVVDTTRVRILGTLRLEKFGRRVADPDAERQPGAFPEDYAASVSGAPGDVLEYCIAYSNIGSDAVTDVAISDPVPFFADALPGAFGAGKAIYWKDADGNVHWLTADGGDDAGAIAAGVLEVQAETTLGPGQGGLVCYRVRIR